MFKADFNKDGHEDLLWRYYGPGGYNRVWFLGNSGGLPMALAASPTAAGDTTEQTKTRTSRKTLADPRDMGWILGRQGKLSAKDAEDVMGTQAVRAGRVVGIDDPRKAGLLKSGSADLTAPPRVADPKQMSLALGAGTAADGQASITATSWLGAADLVYVADVNWQIVGTGDFNNDGNTDILWRYNGPGGMNVVWLMNGTNYLVAMELIPVADLNWQIVGTGDFNNDGNTDILWRYNGNFYGTDGFTWIWYMDGTNVIGGAQVLSVSDLNWQIVGTGDFNKDGNVDLLWRYNGAGGYNVVWYMDGPNWLGTAQLYLVGDLNWKVGGVGDFNNDGNVDIVWRYFGFFDGVDGITWFWYLNGATWIGGEGTYALPVPDLLWKIVNR
jgi:hypothetical protein